MKDMVTILLVGYFHGPVFRLQLPNPEYNMGLLS